VLAKTLETRPMRIVAYAVLSNHWHFVLWPRRVGDLGAFMQKLTITHVRNWQENRRRVGYGHLYQGRYKSFPIQSDEHFYQVVRYVERNPLRAGLVDRAEDWRWGSLWRRTHGPAELGELLSDWPLPRPRLWLQHVNRPQSDAEVQAIRRSVQRGQPYGEDPWVRKTALQLGLESTLRARGRPRKVESNEA
jgi:putative transposase